MAKKETKSLSLNDLSPVILKLGYDISGVKNSLKDAEKAQDSFTKNSEDSSSKVKAGLSKIEQTITKVHSQFSRVVPLGLSLSLPLLIGQAHGLNQEMIGHANSLNSLTDSSGSASAAMGTMFSTWGKSGASLGTIKSVMESLNANEMPVTTKGFKNLTAVISNLHQASGISIDTLSDLTAGMMNFWQVSQSSTTKAVDNILAMQDAFGFTNKQMESVMKLTSTAMNNLGVYFENADSSIKSLSKGISAASGVMKKFGVSVQKSSDFLQKMLDPENINENLALFARLGISYEDTMDMMTSANGQEMFLDKMMTNLPALSKQIQSLKNPMARLQFSKSLGLPLEIAQKMAKATSGEISELMTDYKNQTIEQKKVEKKQARMAADSARFDEQMNFFKMKALMPMMKFVREHMGDFMKLVSNFSGVFSNLLKIIIKPLQTVTAFLVPALTDLMSGNFTGFFDNISKGVTTLITKHGKSLYEGMIKFANAAWDFVSSGIVTAFKSIPKVVGALLTSGPLGKALLGFAAYKAYDFGKDFVSALRGKKGSRRNPMYVKQAGDIFGATMPKWLNKIPGLSKLTNVFSRFKGVTAASGGKLLNGMGFGGVGEKLVAKGTTMLNAGGGLVEKGIGSKVLSGVAKISGKQGLKAIPGIGLVISAVMGGFEAAGKSAKYFNKENKLTAKELEKQEAIRQKQTKGMALNKNEKAFMKNADKKSKTTIGEDIAAFDAGALTLGIGPLIDSIFGTDITGSFARGLHGMGVAVTEFFTGGELTKAEDESFKALSKKATTDATSLTDKELAQYQKLHDKKTAGITKFTDDMIERTLRGDMNLTSFTINGVDALIDTKEMLGIKELNAAEKGQLTILKGKISNGKKLSGAELKVFQKLQQKESDFKKASMTDTMSVLLGKIAGVVSKLFNGPDTTAITFSIQYFFKTIGIKLASGFNDVQNGFWGFVEMLETIMPRLERGLFNSIEKGSLFDKMGIKDLLKPNAKDEKRLNDYDKYKKLMKRADKADFNDTKTLMSVKKQLQQMDPKKYSSEISNLADQIGYAKEANNIKKQVNKAEEAKRKQDAQNKIDAAKAREAAAMKKKDSKNLSRIAGYGGRTAKALEKNTKKGQTSNAEYLDYFFNNKSFIKGGAII